MVPLIQAVQNRQTHRDRKRRGSQGPEGRRKNGELVLMGTTFQLYKMKIILEMGSGDAAQQCECI